MGSNGRVGTHSAAVTNAPTIVIGRKGSIGAVSYVNDPCWPIDTTYYVRPKTSEIDLRWLYWMLPLLGMKHMNKSAAVPGLNRDDVYRKSLSLPPLAEQRRIAAILDQADALRASQSQVLHGLAALTDSLFVSMFGNPNDFSTLRSRALLGQISTVATGSTPKRDHDEYYGGTIPWVKTAEVDGLPIRNTEEKVTHAGVKAARLRVFEPESILVAMYGQGRTRGQSSRLTIAATTNQACAVIAPSAAFESRFMSHQLRLMYPTLRALGRGGNQANLNLELVRRVAVVVPNLSDQKRFAATERKIEDVAAAARQKLVELDALFASLQHRAFRGEL